MAKSIEDYFTATSAWQCDKCGALIACELEACQEHLESEHRFRGELGI